MSKNPMANGSKVKNNFKSGKSMAFETFYTEQFVQAIEANNGRVENQIFVIMGQVDLLDTASFVEQLADRDTFDVNGGEELFNDQWIMKLLMAVNTPKAFHVLSYPQFSYLTSKIDGALFKERVTLLRDNLRQVFPVAKGDYYAPNLENDTEDAIEVRPEALPLYQAEQMLRDGDLFYTVKSPVDDFYTVDVFTDELKVDFLPQDSGDDFEVIDISADPYALDLFINGCIKEGDFGRKATVKKHTKQLLSSELERSVPQLNALLYQFGGGLYYQEVEVIKKDYQPREETVGLLKKYWGKDATFRTLEVYENPDANNKLVEISQGQIVDTIIQKLPDNEVAVGYHGRMTADEKSFAYDQFLNGDKLVMVSTKAFGMGVDIPDIELVYHHAPSGLLPDYVQEIGRAARDSQIKGVAALNFQERDLTYARQLYGMSAIRTFQLRWVLKKLHDIYEKNGYKRNMLFSVDDFGHIFKNDHNLDQKVLTSLMMLEKDYLAKTRFNVLVARPKKLFVKVYARLSEADFKRIQHRLAGTYTIIPISFGGNVFIELDLDRLWVNHFSHMSFPTLKYYFYRGILFRDEGVTLQPQLRFSYKRTNSFEETSKELVKFFDMLKAVFTLLGNGYFTEHDLVRQIVAINKDKAKAKKVAEFVLSSYSGSTAVPGMRDTHNAFLQRRTFGMQSRYRVFNTKYNSDFASILNAFYRLFKDDGKELANRFVTNKDANSERYYRLGHIMELLDLGTFEVKGGENPMVFVRLNDPERIARDADDRSYSNMLLDKTNDRHELSNDIFRHFFTRSFTNEERWDFIEDYFLGDDVDELIANHEGGESNRVNIIERIENSVALEDNLAVDEGKDDRKGKSLLFDAEKDHYYRGDELMSIETAEGMETMRVSVWVTRDPVAFDKEMRSVGFKLNPEFYAVMHKRLRNHHFEYLRDSRRLRLQIRMSPNAKMIQAKVPYEADPVGFYRWWLNNQDQVTMNLGERIQLFNRVYLMEKKVLQTPHLEMILVDFSIHSGKNRMFVYDMKEGKVVYACPVSHGIGSGREAVPERFSNTPNSLMSSLGLATLGHRDYSPQGTKFKYWLDGHESSNNKMKQRLVVMHSYGGVPSEPIYPRRTITSEGCLMLGDEALRKLDNIIKAESNQKIVVYSFQNNKGVHRRVAKR